MATNKKSRDTMVVVAVIVAACVTILANLLADKKFARIDLTKDSRYSLSQPFTNIVGRLEDNLKVTYYCTSKWPEEVDHFRLDMLDKLKEVESASKGKIKIEVIDPSDRLELRERLTKDNFSVEVPSYKKDQKSLTRIFTGLEITYQDKPKIPIPSIWQAEYLEYAIGSSIVDLTTSKKPIIAVYAPHDAGGNPMMMRQAPDNPFDWITHGLWDQEKKFDVRAVDLTENSTIPPDTALFMMFRPRNLNDRQKYEVAKYLAGGGKMLLAASTFNVSYEFGARVEKTPSGLEDYLKELGVTMGQDFIADNSSLKLPVINPMTRQIEAKTFPLFINIQPENIDQESLLTKLLPSMVVLSPAAITLDQTKLDKNGLKGNVLAKTSKETWVIPYSDGIDLNRETEDNENRKYDGSRNVFVMLEGQFPFSYEGKPVPAWTPAAGAPPPKDAKDKKEEKSDVTKKPGWLAVFSGPEAFQSLYINSRDLGQFMQSNIMVIRNIADNFGMGDDLIRLRTKQYEARVIKAQGGSDNDTKRTILKIALIGGPSAALFLFALFWFIWRRAAQTAYERKFAQTIGPSSFSS